MPYLRATARTPHSAHRSWFSERAPRALAEMLTLLRRLLALLRTATTTRTIGSQHPPSRRLSHRVFALSPAGAAYVFYHSAHTSPSTAAPSLSPTSVHPPQLPYPAESPRGLYARAVRHFSPYYMTFRYADRSTSPGHAHGRSVLSHKSTSPCFFGTVRALLLSLNFYDTRPAYVLSLYLTGLILLPPQRSDLPLSLVPACPSAR